jgi:rubrerythrin
MAMYSYKSVSEDAGKQYYIWPSKGEAQWETLEGFLPKQFSDEQTDKFPGENSPTTDFANNNCSNGGFSNDNDISGNYPPEDIFADDDVEENINENQLSMEFWNKLSKPAQSKSEIYGILREALKEEAGDAKEMEQIMPLVTSPEDREILRQIRMDEQKHYKIFQDICFMTNGEKPHLEAEVTCSYGDLAGIYGKKMFNKHKSVEFYRKILFALRNRLLRDMLYEVISDEQNHATQFAYLYAKNNRA